MLPVDNRAVKLGGVTGLQLALREAPQTVESWIDNPVPTRLSLPCQAIDLWKEQFAALAHQPATKPRKQTSDGRGCDVPCLAAGERSAKFEMRQYRRWTSTEFSCIWALR